MTDTPPAVIQSVSPKKPRPPFRVFLPAIGVGIVFALYTVYWFIAADKLRDGIENFSTLEHPSDISVDWSALGISGYPYRIAATFTKPLANAPRSPENWAWNAESLEADFLPYDLRHVVLKVDGEQQLQYSDVRGANPQRHLIRAKAEGTWASYVDVKGVPFGRLAIDIDKLVATRDVAAAEDINTAPTNERLIAGRLQLHMRPSEDTDGGLATPLFTDTSASYDMALQGDNMVLASAGPAKVLGPNVELISVQARLRDVPRRSQASLVELSRDFLQQGGHLTVSDLRIVWGPLDLWAQGEMTLDNEARPKGHFDAEITNYAGLLEALVKAGIVRAEDARLANVGLGFVAELQGKSDGRVSVPITMTQGKLLLGPLVVAHLDPIY